LAVFRLDFDQTGFNLVENAFATRQLAALATSVAFYAYDILARACAEIKIWRRKRHMSLGFSIFHFFFFRLSFFSFSFLFAAVIDLLLGLLAVKKLLRKRHRDGQFLRWSSHVVARAFALSFSPNFFEHFCAYLGLHSANHPDLGIIGKMFSTCRS